MLIRTKMAESILIICLVGLSLLTGCKGNPKDSSSQKGQSEEASKISRKDAFNMVGADTFIVYDNGNLKASGRMWAHFDQQGSLRVAVDGTVAVIVFRSIPERHFEVAKRLGVEPGCAYFLVWDAWDDVWLDEDIFDNSSVGYEYFQKLDLSFPDPAIAATMNIKVEATPAKYESGESHLFFRHGEKVKLPFLLAF